MFQADWMLIMHSKTSQSVFIIQFCIYPSHNQICALIQDASILNKITEIFSINQWTRMFLMTP